MRRLTLLAASFLAFSSMVPLTDLLAADTAPGVTQAGAQPDSQQQITQADQHPGDWLAHGRSWSEQRFSPLSQINAGNIAKLHLAWHMELDTNRGQEGSPIVKDGIIYESTAWSMVKAVDGATGKLIWAFDPKVDGGIAKRGCCDIVNRGVALWNGKIYVATYDARLIALDAKDGHVLWSINTVPQDAALGTIHAYTITGAPLVTKGRVIIGNGGAELGARGFISAFDADTGKLDWRFFLVPNPQNKPDGAASDAVLQKKAYPTWSKGGAWITQGGGGTAWDSIEYDPVTDLVYVGTGNGSPWSHGVRSEGKGDNLFLSSIVALKPETGEYVWHFQETPMDQWDYTAVQQIMTLDMPVDGKLRHVVVHAPKNGFFYVLDAKTGAFISGKPFTYENWAKGLDPKTGRPIFNPDALYSTAGKHSSWFAYPGAMGGHGVGTMSYSPMTKLVYIPVQQEPDMYLTAKTNEIHPDAWNLGQDMEAADARDSYKQLRAITKDLKGWLEAWDPVQQRVVWRAPQIEPINGGTLATAGDLVFQGLADGTFHAYDSRTGKDLYSFEAGSGILAPPVAYLANGHEYVVVEVGYGGGYGIYPSGIERRRKGAINHSRLIAFSLDGTDKLAADAPDRLPPLNPPATYDKAKALAGSRQFALYCQWCHGANAASNGLVPDLRYEQVIGNAEAFQQIVGKGILSAAGMDRFDASLSPDEIETIRQYLIWRARQTLEEQKSGHTPDKE